MRPVQAAASLVSCLMLCVSVAQADECVADGDEVALSGEISCAVFPGPLNYRSIQDGDTPETFWILAVRVPVCFRRLDFERGLLVEGIVVEQFHLVLDQVKYNQYAYLLGLAVEVHG